MSKSLDIVKANAVQESAWAKEAAMHRDNWCWMKYSMQIALKVRGRMKETKMTQAALASTIGCSQQYVSLLLKGKENLTLDTIAKLESALEITLLEIG